MCYVVGGGVDYTDVSTNITFFAGSTSQVLNVTLIDDNVLEPTEQFEAVIKAIHLISGQQLIPPVVLGSVTEADGDILDNDGKLYAFTLEQF